MLKIKRKTLLQWGLIIAIIFSFRYYQTNDLLAGEAPIITAKTISGDMIHSKSDNAPIIVHFWATWCTVCHFENSNIQNLSKEYRVINIAMSSGSDAQIIAYAKEEGLRLDNIVNDRSGSLAKIFNARATPTSFFIKDNIIHFREVGYTTELGMRIRMWLLKHFY